ncbi:MAG: dethiobiotin synthase [Planctomycetaceae bacterium]|nr:dethiobiotin synthase [Planctomycetaceae bacterium]
MSKYPKVGLFVVGTDTEVGKTYVTALIAKQLHDAGKKVGVYKPVASDCYDDGDQVISEDALTLWHAAGQPGTVHDVCPQRFRAPLAPHLAARAEGKELDVQLMRTGLEKWSTGYDIVLIEGVGGLMTPVSDAEYVADLAYEFGFPLLLVAPNMLGVINQTLQSLITAAAFENGLNVAGLILNNVQFQERDVSVKTNRQEIERRTSTPILAEIAYNADEFPVDVDWIRLATRS